MTNGRYSLRSKYIRRELTDKFYLGLLGGIGLFFGGLLLGSIPVGLLSAGLIVAYLLPVLRGYPKDFTADLARYSVTAEQVETDLAAGKVFHGVTVGKRFLVAFAPAIKVIPLRDIIWCYGVNTTVNYRAYGIVSMGKGMEYALKLVCRDKSETPVGAKNAEEVQSILREIKTRAPGVIIGYNQELENKVKSHFAEAIQHVDRHNAGVL